MDEAFVSRLSRLNQELDEAKSTEAAVTSVGIHVCQRGKSISLW